MCILIQLLLELGIVENFCCRKSVPVLVEWFAARGSEFKKIHCFGGHEHDMKALYP